MAAGSQLNSSKGSQQTSSMLAEAGGLEIKTNMWFDKSSGSQLPEDNSYVLLQSKTKELIQMGGGNITVKATGDLYIGAAQNRFDTTAGDHQVVVAGDKHDVNLGNETKQVGEANAKQIDAAQKLNKATSEIDKKKMDTIKSTEGQPVECPVCATEILTDRGQCLLDEAIKLIRLAIPNFPYPLDVVQKLLDFLGIPFLTPEPVKTLNGGAGCGSPGCDGGMVKSPQPAIQKANEEAANELKSKQEELAKYQKDMGDGGTHTMGPYTGDVAVHVGSPGAMNDAPTVVLKDWNFTPFGLTNDTTPQGTGFIPHTKGNCEKAIHSDPLINPGSFSLTVNEKMTIEVGAPGIDVHTIGKVQLNGAVTNIVATDGELGILSNNRTTIKGKNVIIDADDKSGDSGISIQATNTMVTGALNVQGDLAVKGHISMDGGISCTHLTCPGERVATGPSGDAHQVESGATWNNPLAGEQATIYDTYDKAYKAISRDVYNFLSLNIANGLAEIKTLIEEEYSSSMLKLGIDCSGPGLPTGFAFTYDAGIGPSVGGPLLLDGYAYVIDPQTGTPLPVFFQGGQYMAYSFVIPGQIMPVYNYTHVHNSPGANHSHDYTVPQMDPMGTNTAARGARPEPSNVPSPAKASGHGSKPGHKTMGDLCLPCINPFGGKKGNGRGNGRRNAIYGLPPEDDYWNTGNYVPADAKFDPDGNLVPPPSIDLNC